MHLLTTYRNQTLRQQIALMYICMLLYLYHTIPIGFNHLYQFMTNFMY